MAEAAAPTHGEDGNICHRDANWRGVCEKEIKASRCFEENWGFLVDKESAQLKLETMVGAQSLASLPELIRFANDGALPLEEARFRGNCVLGRPLLTLAVPAYRRAARTAELTGEIRGCDGGRLDRAAQAPARNGAQRGGQRCRGRARP